MKLSDYGIKGFVRFFNYKLEVGKIKLYRWMFSRMSNLMKYSCGIEFLVEMEQYENLVINDNDEVVQRNDGVNKMDDYYVLNVSLDEQELFEGTKWLLDGFMITTIEEMYC